jgi:ACS family D-galactonate transporter-like MFS transporter
MRIINLVAFSKELVLGVFQRTSYMSGMRRLYLTALLFCRISCSCFSAERLPDLPDGIGRAGMMAAVVRDTDGNDAILAAGGANFPDGMPWEGGIKKFHREIFLLHRVHDAWRWKKVGDLPEANAYAAFCAMPDASGMLIAGGVNGERHFEDVLLVSPDGKVERHASKLPSPRAYSGFCVSAGKFRIVGGTASPDAVECIANALVLDLSAMNVGWRIDLESKRCARILPLCGGFSGRVVWGGGCALEERDGKAVRVYLGDVRGSVGGNGSRSALAVPLAACAGPGVEVSGGVIFVGGDDGMHPSSDLKGHPGQSKQVIFLYGETLATVVVGQWPTPLATAPLVRLGNEIVSISGEIRPGVRTSAVNRWLIPPEFR